MVSIKRLGKSIGRSEGLRRLACRLLALYIRLVLATSRIRCEGPGLAVAQARWAAGEPFILCFWHGRLLLMPGIWRTERVIHMLISDHRDGRLIANTVAHFGIETIAGSTTRGGAGAFRALLRCLKSGGFVGVTPDGPRGPRMRVGGAVIDLARLSGVPILPATVSVSGGRVLGSWDRFLLARPFCRGVFLWGEPLQIPRDAEAATLAAASVELEARMNAMVASADRACGREPVVPADTGAGAGLAQGTATAATQGGEAAGSAAARGGAGTE